MENLKEVYIYYVYYWYAMQKLFLTSNFPILLIQ